MKAKTKNKGKTTKPVWNETFVISLESASEIEFEIFDQTSLRGLVFFKFQEVDFTEPLNAWVEVEPQGRLHIQMTFSPPPLFFFFFLFFCTPLTSSPSCHQFGQPRPSENCPRRVVVVR